MTRALAMVSGGLDSILAAKLIKEQGIEVIGICFKSYFFNEDNAKRMLEQIDVPLVVVDFSKEHFEMVKNPKNGYGKNINPCIDCHAMMMKYSGELLEKYEADFIITGEVLGQRPMSQNRGSLDKVLKESGIGKKILRPLCAKNLPATEMEEEGLVDREKLLDIKGRTRTVQMELAEKWGIKDYPSPAGGCKLTEPSYANKLKEILKYKSDVEPRELSLLKIGRHYRITENAKIITTRNVDEGELIKQFLNENDLFLLVRDFNGPITVIIGEASDEDVELAAKISGRYSKGKDKERIVVKYGIYGQQIDKEIEVKPADDELLDKYTIK